MSTMSLVCVSDYETKALSLLNKQTRDFISDGADDQQTLYDNTRDFQRFRFRPRMMVDVSQVKLETSILGNSISFPVCIAPSGCQKLAHPMGEIATAKAAEEMGVCMCLSTGSNISMGEVASSAPRALKWFQLYVCKERRITERLVKQAEVTGYKALVVTVDFPRQGLKRSAIRNRFVLPPHLRYKNFEGISAELGSEDNKAEEYAVLMSMIDSSLTWADLTWLTKITTLPVVAKGILTGHDALKAVDAGCKAVYVSNHGGRQLDGVSSAISCLSEVVKAVNGRVEVYMDGGVRTGTDVLKALALGARAVFIGRPALWGLTVGGEEGVKSLLTILKQELKLAMQLSGVTDVQQVPKQLLSLESTISRL